MDYQLGQPPGLQELEDALGRRPPRLDLAAIAVARLGNPGLAPGVLLERLDALAARVAGHRGLGALPALTKVLVDEEGFEGDREDYRNPRNSFLDVVLERRRGLPILLSTVYLEVGRRAGIAVEGIALPGHFVARVGATIVDPFNRGKVLDEAACEAIVERFQPGVGLSLDLLRPPTVRAIAWRMLNNLKTTWLGRGAHEDALRAVDLMLAVEPGHPGELRLRAGLLTELGAYRAALADLERCLACSPPPRDEDALRRAVDELRERIGMLH